MKHNQKGSALAVSLALLTAITFISVTSMQRSGLQTKIVTNLQHHEVLFQTALNEQEYWWKEVQTDGSLITKVQDSFTLDANNRKLFTATPLIDQSGFNTSILNINHSSQLIVIPPTVGDIALTDGGEVGEGASIKLRISSNANAGVERPTLISNQLSGVTADLLSNASNSY